MGTARRIRFSSLPLASISIVAFLDGFDRFWRGWIWREDRSDLSTFLQLAFSALSLTNSSSRSCTVTWHGLSQSRVGECFCQVRHTSIERAS